MKDQITSESKFIWKFIGLVLLTPITLIQVLFKKKEFSDLFLPFKYLFHFIFEPKFTITIIGINILIFIISAFLPEQTLLNFAQYPSDLFTAKFYTIFTAGFMHANLTHLFGNMLILFIFGRALERKIGIGKTALIYFGALILSGIFSALVNIMIGDNTPGLGASGALMGLIAAAILIDPLYFTYELIIPLPIMVVGWVAIFADITGILNPVEDGIGHFAHLGGFLSIALLAFILGLEERKQMIKGLIINIISLIVIGGVYLLFF